MLVYINAPLLQKNDSTVKVYVNGEFLIKKNFRNAKKRKEWMHQKESQLMGCCGFYFIISHREYTRKKPMYIYQRERRAKLKDNSMIV